MTKPLILAIEPDPHKALQLKSIARQVHAELRLASSMGEALAAFSERIPDLILIPALIMARDDLALTERLRQLGDSAAHIQTLTIPILETAEMTLFGSGVFGTPRRQRPNLGCEAGTFAEQVGIYLERASEAREKYSPSSTPSDLHSHADVHVHAFVGETPLRYEEPAVTHQAPHPDEMRADMDETPPAIEEPSVVNAAPLWDEEFIDIEEGALPRPEELGAADEAPVLAEVSFGMEDEPLPLAGEFAGADKAPVSAIEFFSIEEDALPEALPPVQELRAVDEPAPFGALDFGDFVSEELLAPESTPSIAAPQRMVRDSPTVFFRQIKAAISNSLSDVVPEEPPEFPSEDPSIVVSEALPLSDALRDFASEDAADAESEERPPSDTWQLLDPDQDRFAALIVRLDAIAVNGV